MLITKILTVVSRTYQNDKRKHKEILEVTSIITANNKGLYATSPINSVKWIGKGKERNFREF